MPPLPYSTRVIFHLFPIPTIPCTLQEVRLLEPNPICCRCVKSEATYLTLRVFPRMYWQRRACSGSTIPTILLPHVQTALFLNKPLLLPSAITWLLSTTWLMPRCILRITAPCASCKFPARRSSPLNCPRCASHLTSPPSTH